MDQTLTNTVNEAAYRAARRSVAWFDLSSLGKLELRGADALDLLNRLSTNELKNLPAAMGSETVLTTEKGRIVDVLTVLPQENFLLVLCSENNAPAVQQWLRKYTIMDDVRSRNATDDYCIIEILGPEASSFVAQALGVATEDFPLYQVRKIAFLDEEILITRRNSYSELSFLLIAPSASKEKIVSSLERYGDEFPQIGSDIYELLRIEAGAGRLGTEWTEEHNPLEAGLLHLISFKKGCYVGQEVIARLDSYNKVKQRITGLKSEVALEPGSVIVADGKPNGKVSSSIYSPALAGPLSLGYLRTEFVQPGSFVTIEQGGENIPAEIIKLPV